MPHVPSGFQAKRIFIVDDDPVHRQLMADALSGRYDVDLAADSETALARLGDGRSSAYDLVIVDLRLPAHAGERPTTEEGRRILEAIQTDSAGSPPVVVVVSANVFDRTRDQLKKFDVKQVFEKPFSLAEFRECIDVLCGGVVAA